jgi:hypothetical protein
MLPAISASLPVWLCVSSEKPSSKLEGARLMPGTSCENRVGEAGACSAMVSEVADAVRREVKSCGCECFGGRRYTVGDARYARRRLG